jgi:hypothetical protein
MLPHLLVLRGADTRLLNDVCHFESTGANYTLAKSRLRFLEDIKKYSHAETGKRIDEPREQHGWGSQSPQDIKNGHDERPS